jgi:hypothetical protein
MGPQLSLLFEPDRLIGAPGLFAGARLVGNDDSGTHAEPLLGYRRELAGEHREVEGELVYVEVLVGTLRRIMKEPGAGARVLRIRSTPVVSLPACAH